MSTREEARTRVTEFVRQWALANDRTDLIYRVHFDAAKGEGADLLASDLAALVGRHE